MNTQQTLGQALRRIKVLKGRVATLESRLSEALVYDKAKEPAFSFSDVSKELDTTKSELVALKCKLANANAITKVQIVDQEVSLAEIVIIISELKGDIARHKRYATQGLRTSPLSVDEHEREEYEDILDARGGYGGQRHVKKVTRTEVVCNVTVAANAEFITKLEDKLAVLNNVLETSNHKVTF